MLSAKRLQQFCQQKHVSIDHLASGMTRGGLNRQQAIAAVKNWRKGHFRPIPRKEDIRNLAAGLAVEVNDLVEWRSSYRFAPGSARKARLVTQLIVGRDVQDAMDILQFTDKRFATMVNKVLKCAVADADEQQADVGNLYVSNAWAEDAGIRIGTKRWIPKDRGRAHPISKRACHIHVVVAQI